MNDPDLITALQRLSTLVNWYWSSGSSDQEEARDLLSAALAGDGDLIRAGQNVYHLAGYYWSEGNSEQLAILEELGDLFGPDVALDEPEEKIWSGLLTNYRPG